jgi:hypothetical protein
MAQLDYETASVANDNKHISTGSCSSSSGSANEDYITADEEKERACISLLGSFESAHGAAGSGGGSTSTSSGWDLVQVSATKPSKKVGYYLAWIYLATDGDGKTLLIN